VIIDVSTFLTLRNTLPVVDVRSEGEFQEGHIHGALNIPILNNEERVIVGTTYKKEGQHEAIRAGFRLVGPRLIHIIEEAERVGNEFIVHCWRGGMRSGNFCQFVGMAGMKTHQLKGGYKAYRQAAQEAFAKPYQFVLVAGFTGSGKSELLRTLRRKGEQVVDLEDLAHHKGSVFGGLGQRPQPTTEQFQNNLFEELLRLDPQRPIWIEDESVAIGKIFLPPDLWKTMGVSPVVAINVPREVRVSRLVAEYGDVDRNGFETALRGITRKLGGQHFNAALDFLHRGAMAEAIDIILNYYDKAYYNGIDRKRDRVKLELPWDGKSIEKFASALVEESGRVLTLKE
jgi:tRNA 2-selenouridine synthase